MRDSPLDDGFFCTALILIAIVLVFEFINGLNDCANLVASSITTGALGLRSALLLLGFFKFIGVWFLGTAVAKTLSEGIVNPFSYSHRHAFCRFDWIYYHESLVFLWRDAIELFSCPHRGTAWGGPCWF